jgi:uncharacterized membrane protein
MTDVGTVVVPTARPTSRVDAVDLARGIALIGMMLVHIGPHWIDVDPPIGSIVAGGRAAPLFAMLAGVSLTLVQRRDPSGAGSARATWIRGLLLVGLGLWLGSLDNMPVLVILAFYGVMIVFALPFRRLSTPALLLVSMAWIVIAPILLLWAHIDHDQVPMSQAELSELAHPLDLLAEIVAWGTYPAGVWFAYVLVGLLVGRLDLSRVATAVGIAASGALLVAATLILGWVAISRGAFDDRRVTGWRLLFARSEYPFASAEWKDLLLVGEHTSRPLNVISAIGSALLIIGLCALVLRVPSARLLMAPLRIAGTMTLTLYTVHVLWAWRLRVEFMHDNPDGFQRGGYAIWLVQVVVLCGFAVLWHRLVGRGPLESIVRLLSVWGRRPGA